MSRKIYTKEDAEALCRIAIAATEPSMSERLAGCEVEPFIDMDGSSMSDREAIQRVIVLLEWIEKREPTKMSNLERRALTQLRDLHSRTRVEPLITSQEPSP